MTIHELKTWPEPFEALMNCTKRFEVRKDDRGFEVGDTLYLREWDPEKQTYSGRSLTMKVTYILHGGDEEYGFNLPSDIVVMSVEHLPTTVTFVL